MWLRSDSDRDAVESQVRRFDTQNGFFGAIGAIEGINA